MELQIADDRRQRRRPDDVAGRHDRDEFARRPVEGGREGIREIVSLRFDDRDPLVTRRPLVQIGPQIGRGVARHGDRQPPVRISLGDDAVDRGVERRPVGSAGRQSQAKLRTPGEGRRFRAEGRQRFFGRREFRQPRRILPVDLRRFAERRLARVDDERQDEIVAEVGPGRDSQGQFVGAVGQAIDRNDAAEAAVVGVGKVRMGGAEVRPEQAVGKLATRLAVEQRRHRADAARRQRPTLDLQTVADNRRHAGGRLVGAGENAAGVERGRIALERGRHLGHAAVPADDPDRQAVEAVGEVVDQRFADEAGMLDVRVIGKERLHVWTRSAVLRSGALDAVDQQFHGEDAGPRHRPARGHDDFSVTTSGVRPGRSIRPRIGWAAGFSVAGVSASACSTARSAGPLRRRPAPRRRLAGSVACPLAGPARGQAALPASRRRARRPAPAVRLPAPER